MLVEEPLGAAFAGAAAVVMDPILPERERSSAVTAGPAVVSTRGAPRPARRPTGFRAPEEALARALAAQTPRSRGIWARKGLATRASLDRTTHSMLLRQLYLSHYEQRHFKKASEIAEQNIALGTLGEFAHQDAARAKQALGDVDGAAAHLRMAARVGPPKRRPFHWWTLGSLYYLAGRYDESIEAMSRAARWGTTDKPLYQGHRAVVERAQGDSSGDLTTLIGRLSNVPAGQGYGRFVLGLLAFHANRWPEAKRYLDAFVRRTTSGRAVLAIALEGELAVARSTLAKMAKG
jgi:tetratricopeptide (TPR) repeat protein